MTVRLSQQEIAEAVQEYLYRRGMRPRENVHFTWTYTTPHSLEASVLVDIDQPPKDGPYR